MLEGPRTLAPMPRQRSPALTDGELRLMRVLWHRGRATVGEVLDAIEERPKPAYNSVLTLLRILEKKGYVKHEKSGRAFVFVPMIDNRAARRTAVRQLLGRFFDNSADALVLNLLRDGDLGTADLERLRALVGDDRHEGHG
jgi:BlaI family transcriptional regulator, penicillinase repressor